MRKTYTAEKMIEILQVYGVPAAEIEKLLERSEKVAWGRNSQVMGFRHLVIAANLQWGNSAEAPPAERAE